MRWTTGRSREHRGFARTVRRDARRADGNRRRSRAAAAQLGDGCGLHVARGRRRPGALGVGRHDRQRAVATTPAEEKLVDFVDAVIEDVAGDVATECSGTGISRPACACSAMPSTPRAAASRKRRAARSIARAISSVYLDLGFFDELQQRFGAAGDFAQAYVLAHEVGHHVQALTGIESRMREMASRESVAAERAVGAARAAGRLLRRRLGTRHATSPAASSDGRVELESGDIEEGLRAAAAIGDDRIQRMQTGRVFPDKFTHGTSEQRVTWFRRGFERGDPEACETFQ